MKNTVKIALPIVSFSFAASILAASFAPARQGCRAEEDEAITTKTIYVDVASNPIFLDHLSSLEAVIGEEDIGLAPVSDEDGLCYFEIEPSALTKKDFALKVFIDEETSYYSESIPSNSVLIKGNYNCVCLASSEQEQEAAPIKGFGYYGEKAANPGASYASQRIWLAEVGESKESASKAVGYFDEEGWNIVNMESYPLGETLFYYADIPYALTSAHFLSFDNEESHLYGEDYEVASLGYGVCYALGNGSLSQYKVSGADAGLLSLVLEAYLTYGSSPSNGAVSSTISNLYSTWFENKSATSAEMKNATILDYTGYTANGNSYEGLTKNSSFSVNEKWNTICSQAGIDPSTGKARSGMLNIGGLSKKTTLLVFGAIAGFVVLLGLFAFLRRRVDLRK